MSVRRSAVVRSRPRSTNQSKVLSIADLKAPSGGAVEAGGGDRGDHDSSRAGQGRPVGRGRERTAAAEPAVLDPEAAELGEHPEIDGEDLAALAPPLGPEQGHHRQRVAAVDEGGGGGRVRVEADGDAAAGAVDDLQPDDREQADRGRPAAERLRVGEVGGALAGDRPEARPRRPAHRAPGVEGPEDVAQQGGEERKAEPGGDEEEGEGEVAIRRFGAAQAGVDGDAEQEDADEAAENLDGPADQSAGEPRPEGAPVRLLETGLAPGRREREEGRDQDDRRPPGEQPGRDRQVLPGGQRVRERQEGHGLTRNSAICSLRPSSSTSKMPSISAGKSKLTVPPAATSCIRS